MNYLEILPSELINIIALYLNYNEIKLKLENFSIDYRYLLSENYPAFYKIIYHLKNNDTVNKKYDYEEGYNLMNLVETLISHKKSSFYDKLILNTRTNDIDKFISIFYNYNIYFPSIEEIISSYSMLTEKSDMSHLFKYRKYFPNIATVNDDFYYACRDYIYYEQTSLQNLISSYSDLIDNDAHESRKILCRIFLSILENKELIKEYKDKIINLEVNKYIYIDEHRVKKDHIDIQNEQIIHQYIINYLNEFK